MTGIPWIVLGMLAFAAHDVAAQAVRRDPTQPPAQYVARPAPVASPAESFHPESVIAVDGRKYILWHGRRYAAGDTVQGARIERIEETEVWVRTADGLRKLPLFAGVEKKREGSK
jgi:hypothetical protein